MKDENLLFVKDLHLIEEIFFNEFTVLFNCFKICGRQRLQLHGLQLAVAVLNLGLDQHALLVPTEQSKLFADLDRLLFRGKPTCPAKITRILTSNIGELNWCAMEATGALSRTQRRIPW